jgi:tetratricopeptide (TPR) repeat protein
MSSKKEDFLKFNFWLTIVASLIVLWEALSLVLVNFSWFGWVNNLVGLVGLSWFDEATYLGLIVVLTLSFLEFFVVKTGKRLKIFSIISLIISLLALVVINYGAVWLMLGIFSLAIIILSIRRGGWTKIVGLPLAVLIISSLFVFWGDNNSWLGRGVVSIQQTAKVNIFEVRPNWTGTYDIAKKVALDKEKTDLIFGMGPGRFWRAWDLHKPEGVNLSAFWNSDFSYGIGFIPSLIVSQGWLSGLAWIFLLLVIAFSVVRAILVYWRDPSEKNGLLIFAILPVVYLWSLLIFRVPGLAILAVAFAFLGWLMLAEKETGLSTNEWKVGKTEKSKELMRRVSWPIFVVLGVVIVYLVSSIVSLLLFWYGGSLASRGKLDQSFSVVSAATWLGRSDVYERRLSEIKVAQINHFLQTATGTPEQAQAKFLSLFNDALSHATKAQNIDNNNYLNWLSVARVYGVAVPLQIKGAEEQAMSAYQKALSLNPTNPSIWYEMSVLSISAKKPDEAKDRLKKAIALKANYLEARFSLAQLALNEGLLSEAIKEAEDTVRSAPEDYKAWFLLGYLKYQNGEIEEATSILARSLQIQPDYADSKYFIGLSLDRLGKKQEAISIFKELANSNPDNKVLQKIISNLEAGKSALDQPQVTAPKSTKTKK